MKTNLDHRWDTFYENVRLGHYTAAMVVAPFGYHASAPAHHGGPWRLVVYAFGSIPRTIGYGENALEALRDAARQIRPFLGRDKWCECHAREASECRRRSFLGHDSAFAGATLPPNCRVRLESGGAGE